MTYNNVNLEEKKKKIQSILDRDYFNTSVQIKDNKTLSWKVTYCNLTDKVYYTNPSKTLLNSDENRISDIYKLKEKFEKEKNKEIMNNLYEIIPIVSEINTILQNFTNIFIKFLLYVSIGMVALNYWNLFNNNDMFSFALLILTTFMCVVEIRIFKQISKERNKAIETFERMYLKEKIKRQGMYFVDRIRI